MGLIKQACHAAVKRGADQKKLDSLGRRLEKLLDDAAEQGCFIRVHGGANGTRVFLIHVAGGHHTQLGQFHGPSVTAPKLQG